MAAMETAPHHTNGSADKPVVVPMNGVAITPPVKLAKNQRRKQNAQNKILEKFGGQPLSTNRKRPNNDTTGPTPSKKAKNGLSDTKPPQTKNPVATLNELRKNLIYKIESQAGPVHAPIFRISVVVDGQKYVGQGRSKKIARSEAAAAALRSFIQFKDGATLTPIKPTTNVDFTSDDHLENANGGDKGKLVEKGPVMLLYELFNDLKFECLSDDGFAHSKFRMIVTINNQNFDGTGPSKKMAKNSAAKAALASLCNISFSPLQQSKITIADETSLTNESKSVELPQTFADSIGKLVLNKYAEIMVGNENYSKRKVLAGFVMTVGSDISTAKVISCATGTKCVSGEHISVSGCVINDSHAEIIARRCLVDFFYSQLDLLTNSDKQYDSIFYKPKTGQAVYKLKENIKFHLYINTAPCGDARVFSPHETDHNHDKHPNRKARGQLRTKVESGEGTIPVKNSEGIQTWDGVLQGQRLLTMSCSDKIARWNVLGLQGALLTSMIEPIYLSSIVLGSLLHPAHMFRAICGRIEPGIEGVTLPALYRLNRPQLAQMTSTETRNQIKPPNYSINWTVGCHEVEVINSFTGKPISGKVSRITKQSFFKRYAKLAKRINLPGYSDEHYYSEVKESIQDYKLAKKALFEAFTREDLGLWLKKPIEQDQFQVLQ